MTKTEIQKLAARNGLFLAGEMRFNEMGVDFKVGFATDKTGQQWVLRVPRRKGTGEQIAMEERILRSVRKYISVQVPDWHIANEELIAYPLLDGVPALNFNAGNYKVRLNIDRNAKNYISSLAKTLVAIHAIPEEEVRQNGLRSLTPEQVRLEVSEQLYLVRSELGLSPALETRYKQWLDKDALWPGLTRFIHGDLYAGHVLTGPDGAVCGIIDWSTAQVSDIARDLAGHLAVFGEESLKQLISEYERQGGVTWTGLLEQTVERLAAAPLAYGFFALGIQDQEHIRAAKLQLGII